MTYWPSVVVATPAHSGLAGPLTYRSEQPLAAGNLVRVPLGAREVLGIVWSSPPTPPADSAEDLLRPVSAVHDAGWPDASG